MAKKVIGADLEQQKKDLIGNKILSLLTICFVSMAVLMFIARVIDNLSTMTTTYSALRVIAVIGAAMMTASLACCIKCKREKEDESLKILTSRNVFLFSIAFTLCVCAILMFHVSAIRALYVLLPVYTGLYIIKNTYQGEFFRLALFSGVGSIFLYFVSRYAGDLRISRLLPVLLGLLAAIAAAKAVWILIAYKNKKGIKLAGVYVWPQRALPWLMVLSLFVFVLACLLYFPLGAAALLYGCWAIGGVFVLGILYYTYELMRE